MKTILVLTKNILADKTIHDNLQKLGYEVMGCSSILNKTAEQQQLLFTYFDYLLLSKTLSDLEIQKITSNIDEKNLCILRELDNKPTLQEQTLKQAMKIDFFILNSHRISQLRDLLIQIEYEKDSLKNNDFTIQFSSVEKQILVNLLENSNQEATSKSVLCQLIWRDNLTQTNLSKLSKIIREINKKMNNSLLDSVPLIISVRRKGYSLNPIISEKPYFRDLIFEITH